MADQLIMHTERVSISHIDKLITFMCLKCVPFFTVTCVSESEFDIGIAKEHMDIRTLKAWHKQMKARFPR